MVKTLTKLTLMSLLVGLGTGCPSDTASTDETVDTKVVDDTDVAVDMTGNMPTCEGTCTATPATCDGDTAVTYTADFDDACTCAQKESKTDCAASNKLCEDGACVAKAVPSCADTTPPERCAQTPDNATWSPASVVSKIELITDEEGCCFDFNGKDGHDNALGGLLNFASTQLPLEELNDTIAQSIENGDIAIIFEHIGLADLSVDSMFQVGFLLGKPETPATGPNADGGTSYLVEPTSFATGSAYPQAVANAEISGNTFTAGPGVVKLKINLFNLDLELVISAAQLQATVNPDNSALDGTGVAMTGGKLGGVLRVDDLINAINMFEAQNCDCLGVEGDFISKGDTPACVTVEQDMNTCDENNETEAICATLANSICTFIPGVAFVTDVNADHIGKDCNDTNEGLKCNALSVGLKFETVGANITGPVQ